jgi:hypothetical protein
MPVNLSRKDDYRYHNLTDVVTSSFGGWVIS